MSLLEKITIGWNLVGVLALKERSKLNSEHKHSMSMQRNITNGNDKLISNSIEEESIMLLWIIVAIE